MFTKTEIIRCIKDIANEISCIRSELNPCCIVISAANYGIKLADRDSYLNVIRDGKEDKWNFACDCLTTPCYTEEDAKEIADYINKNDSRKVVVVKPRLRKNLEALLADKLDTLKTFCNIYKKI